MVENKIKFHIEKLKAISKKKIYEQKNVCKK